MYGLCLATLSLTYFGIDHFEHISQKVLLCDLDMKSHSAVLHTGFQYLEKRGRGEEKMKKTIVVAVVAVLLVLTVSVRLMM